LAGVPDDPVRVRPLIVAGSPAGRRREAFGERYKPPPELTRGIEWAPLRLPQATSIGRHLGMFKDRIEHTGKDGGAIEFADLTTAERARALAAFVAETRSEI
jgi:hypothetical protein